MTSGTRNPEQWLPSLHLLSTMAAIDMYNSIQHMPSTLTIGKLLNNTADLDRARDLLFYARGFGNLPIVLKKHIDVMMSMGMHKETKITDFFRDKRNFAVFVFHLASSVLALDDRDDAVASLVQLYSKDISLSDMQKYEYLSAWAFMINDPRCGELIQLSKDGNARWRDVDAGYAGDRYVNVLHFASDNFGMCMPYAFFAACGYNNDMTFKLFSKFGKAALNNLKEKYVHMITGSTCPPIIVPCIWFAFSIKFANLSADNQRTILAIPFNRKILEERIGIQPQDVKCMIRLILGVYDRRSKMADAEWISKFCKTNIFVICAMCYSGDIVDRDVLECITDFDELWSLLLVVDFGHESMRGMILDLLTENGRGKTRVSAIQWLEYLCTFNRFSYVMPEQPKSERSKPPNERLLTREDLQNVWIKSGVAVYHAVQSMFQSRYGYDSASDVDTEDDDGDVFY